MAYYTALVTAWNSATQPPTGVTGTGLTGGMTTAQKLAAINGWTVPTGVPVKAILTPSQIINACVPGDIAALPTASVTLLALLLSGATVDGSIGTTVRAGVQAIFAGKTTTLAQLGALVAPFDNPVQPWWQANGYSSPISQSDLTAAGGLS